MPLFLLAYSNKKIYYIPYYDYENQNSKLFFYIHLVALSLILLHEFEDGFILVDYARYDLYRILPNHNGNYRILHHQRLTWEICEIHNVLRGIVSIFWR